MPRLPQPGQDHGTWGDILNDFLSQTLAANGQLKSESVGSAQLRPDAVTATSIADGSITNDLIANGTIQEAKLSSFVQTKLNATGGIVNSVIAGSGVAVDVTDPANPTISSTLASSGAMTLYVDKANGTDAPDKGGSSGAGAVKTIQYAFDLLPPLISGNVTINISGDAYTESPTLRGKSFSGDYTITLQGTVATVETLAVGANSQQGAFLRSSDHMSSTVVRSSGSWAVNDRRHKWLKIPSSGDIRLIDSNTASTLYLTGYPLTATPANGEAFIIQEPTTSITDLRIGNNQTNVIINDISFPLTVASNQTLFGKYVDVILNRCSFPLAALSSLWTNKDNSLFFNDCFFLNTRLFVRGGAKVILMGGKLFRPGTANRCIQVDEGAVVHVGDGVVVDGDHVANSAGIMLGGLAIANFNGNAPDQSSSRQYVCIRNFTTAGVQTNAIGVPLNAGWSFILFGNDIMPNVQETITGVFVNKLVDASVDFSSIGVVVGDKVQNLTDNSCALVTAIDSSTQLSLSEDIFTATNKRYRIVSNTSLNGTDVTIALDSASTVRYKSGLKSAALGNLEVTAGGGGAPSLALSGDSGAMSGVTFGSTQDTNLYRSAANTLRTDDNLVIGAPGTVTGSVSTIDGVQVLTNKSLTSPKITSGHAPSSSSSAGTVGQVEWDADYIYICIASNVWKRSSLSSW